MTDVPPWIRRGRLEGGTGRAGVPGPVMSGDFHGSQRDDARGRPGVSGCAAWRGAGFLAPHRVVTPRHSAALGSARVESQVDGGPQVKPRSPAVLRLEVGLAEVGAHLIQAPL